MHCNNGLNNKLVVSLVENKVAEETGDLKYLQDSMYDFVSTLKEIILGEYSPEFFNEYVDEALKLHGSNLEEFLKIPKMGLELRQALNSIDDAIDISNQEFRDNLVLLLDRFQTTIDNIEYEARDPYDTAVELGFQGTKQEWINHLEGDSAYEIATLNGFQGTEKEWLEHLEGDTAYEVAVKNGYNGTQSEWLLYIRADGFIQSIQQFATNDAEIQVQIPDYGTINSLQGYIKEMFENGALPATPFATKALMTASALVDGDYAMVTDDTVVDNNGLYVKAAGTWVKSAYDPFNQAVNQAVKDVGELLSREGGYVYDQSIFTLAGSYTASGSVNAGNPAWRRSELKEVKKGDVVRASTVMAVVGLPYLVFFDTAKKVVEVKLADERHPNLYEHPAYICPSDGYVSSQHQSVAEGCTISIFTAGFETLQKYALKDAIIPIDAIDGYLPLINLFDKRNVFTDSFVNSSTGNFDSNSPFPKTIRTGYIAVEPNTTYYLNFNDTANWYAEYDSDKVYVRGAAGRQTFSITTSNATRFIAVTINTLRISLDDFYITEDESADINQKEMFTWLPEMVRNIVGDTSTSTPTPSNNRFKGKKLLVTGDSITDSNNNHATTWWHGFLKDWLDLGIVQNDGKSGTGLVKGFGSVLGTNYRLANWQTTYIEPDLILIMGNMNDGTTTAPTNDWSWIYGGEGDPHKGDWSTIITEENMKDSLWYALRYLFQTLLTMYPNKPIGFIISAPRGVAATRSGIAREGYNSNDYGSNGWFSEWAGVIETVAGHYSIPTLNLYHNSGLRPWLAANNTEFFGSGDKIHPNTKGHEIMANKILPFVEQFM